MPGVVGSCRRWSLARRRLSGSAVDAGPALRAVGCWQASAGDPRRIEGESVLFETEGVRVTVHRCGRVPGARDSGGVSASVGGFAVTDRRVIGASGRGKLVDVPCDAATGGPATLTLDAGGVACQIRSRPRAPSCHGELRVEFRQLLTDVQLVAFPARELSFGVDPQKVVRLSGALRSCRKAHRRLDRLGARKIYSGVRRITPPLMCSAPERRRPVSISTYPKSETPPLVAARDLEDARRVDPESAVTSGPAGRTSIGRAATAGAAIPRARLAAADADRLPLESERVICEDHGASRPAEGAGRAGDGRFQDGQLVGCGSSIFLWAPCGRSCTAIVSAGMLLSFRSMCTSLPPASTNPCPAVYGWPVQVGSSPM